MPPDFQFHMEVARATGNRHFADLMTHLGTMIIPRARVDTPKGAPEGRLNYLHRVNAEHESIYRAIRAKDVEGREPRCAPTCPTAASACRLLNRARRTAALKHPAADYGADADAAGSA